MLPTLQIGPLNLQTYPLALLLGCWVALAVGAWAARQTGLDGDHIYNAGIYGLLAGLVAGRLAHVAAYWTAYRDQPLEIIGLNAGAFLVWPAVVAALAGAGWYVYRHKLPVAAVLDAFAPGLLVGLAIFDLGALLAGQTLGAPAALPWAISIWGVTRHPVQVYEALAALIAAGATIWVLRMHRRPGTAAWVALLGYGLSRWLLEPFRAESILAPGGFRAMQLLGLAAVLVALWALRQEVAAS
jgi:phosphatidylglycerol---prolipoprotein diacylglyceryl transferase